MTTTPRLNETVLFRRTLARAIALPIFLLIVLAYLLAACGGSATGSASPTLGPIARDTPLVAPTQPAQPTVAVVPSVVAAHTPLVLPTTAAATPSAAPLPAATTQPSAANLLISYHKSGGIAGVDETFSVYADGTTELRNKSGTVSAHADPSAIQALQTLLASPEFAALQIPVQPPVPDQFIYELTLPGRTKPLIATDGVDNPPALRELIDMLEQLKTQAK